MIRTPFNFVPLSEHVAIDWNAENISHDIPFEDGISGTIDLTITAKSDIFIRNGHAKEDAEANHRKGNEEYNSFSHITGPDGKPLYFIPGSSIKGEVRNILEILSFSKLTVDKNAMFAHREMSSHNFELVKHQKDIHCGWLRRKGSGYEITDCGRPMRISHPDIDAYLGKDIMRRHFSKRDGVKLNKEQEGYDPKTAVYKYHLLNGYNLEGLSFKIYEDNTLGNHLVRYDQDGDIRGTIVLTGQPDLWSREKNSVKGKYYEFVFEDTKVHDPRTLTEKEFEHFAFIYKDSKERPRIERLLDDRKGRGVPVFFRCNGNNISDFGMAYIYKVPYRHSVYDALPESHRQNMPDLAQCIFGYTESDGVTSGDTKSLKGRVQFGNAFAVKAEEEPDEVRLVLGQPRASFYPIYVKQQGTEGQSNNLKTYNDGIPNGWKRYYLRENTWEKTASDTTDTWIQPLKKGAVFKGVISFHNLRPFELGALLSALTFHHTDGCLHQLGQAKPYGYGKCTYDISLHATELKELKSAENSKETAHDVDYYLSVFEKSMNDKFGLRWIIQPQITELLTLASNDVNGPEFEYMVLDPTSGIDEFKDARQNNNYLPLATEIGMKVVTGNSLIGKLEKIHLAEIKTHYEEAIKAAYNDLTSLKALEDELKKEKESSKVEEEQKLLNDLYNQVVARKIELMEPKAKTPEEIIKAGIQAFIPKGSSFNQVANRLKKWLDALEETDRQRVLNTEDANYAFQKMKEAYDAANKNEKKKWSNGGKYYKNCVKIVGKDLSDVWFSKINEEDK